MSKVPGKKRGPVVGKGDDMIVEHNKKRQCKDCGDDLHRKHEHKRCDSCHHKHRREKKCGPKCDVLRFTEASLQQLSDLLETLEPAPLPALALNMDFETAGINPPTFLFPGVTVEAPIAIPLPFLTTNQVSDSMSTLIANGYIASSATTAARMIAPRTGKYELNSSISMNNQAEAIAFSLAQAYYRLRIYRGIVPVLIFTRFDRVPLPAGMGTVTVSMSNTVNLMAGDQWEYTLEFDSNPTSSNPFNWMVSSYTNAAEFLSQ